MSKRNPCEMSTLHLHSCLHCAPCQRAKRINPGKLIEWPSRTKRQRPKLLKRRPSRWQAWSGISRTSWVEVSKRLQYVLWDDATHQYKSWAIPIDYLFTALYYINLRSFLPQLLKQLHWLCSRFNLYSCRKWQLLWWSHGSAEKGLERPLQETGATAGNMIMHEMYWCCSDLWITTIPIKTRYWYSSDPTCILYLLISNLKDPEIMQNEHNSPDCSGSGCRLGDWISHNEGRQGGDKNSQESMY